MMALDAPLPESLDTLREQQRQLLAGDRAAQLFPPGHEELPIPRGMQRLKTPGGVFHYNRLLVTPKQIHAAVKAGRENEILGLGPVSKDDAMARVGAGERPVAVTERTPEGIEARTAAGTTETALAQLAAMAKGASPENSVQVESPTDVLAGREGLADGGTPEESGGVLDALLSGRLASARQGAADKSGRIADAVVGGLRHWIETPGRAMREGITTEQAVDWAAPTALGMIGAGRLPGAAPEGAVVGIFGGKLAKTADHAALARAEELAAKGTPREQIWNDTGWFQGSDKQWRFEIPDHPAQIGEAGKAQLAAGSDQPIAGLLWHKPLYDAYPSLRGITAKPENVTGGSAGSYVPPVSIKDAELLKELSGTPTTARNEAVVFNLARSDAPMKDVALHEMQHAVQAREGFANGASPEMFKQQKDAEMARSILSWRRELDSQPKTMDRHARENAAIEQYKKLDAMDWLPSREVRDLAHDRITNPDAQLQALVNLYGLDQRVTPLTPREMYQRSAGEVEARNVQARKNMSPEERRATPPWATEDFPTERQINPAMLDILTQPRADGGAVHMADGGVPALPEGFTLDKPAADVPPLPEGFKLDQPTAAKPATAAASTWSDVPLAALKNAPASAVKFGTDLIHPFLHPIETAENLKNLGLGIAEKTGMKSGEENVKYADAVGRFFADRYGGTENLKQTMAADPVGFLSDLSMLLSGGATATARGPAILGSTSRVLSTAARATDPLSAVGATVRMAGKGASEIIGGIGTHTGGETLRIAAKAGYEGGDTARAFQESLRGAAPIEDVVSEARTALSAMRKERGETYVQNMAKLASDPTILDFAKIDHALADISAVKTFKGQVISESTQAIRQKIGETVRDWKALEPKEFHTVEGLDALKQKIGDIRDATQFGTPERVVADRAYQAIRNTIIQQAPEYARVMKGYEQASKQIKEIEKTLSLNPNANIDTALRKLQSVMRNNVNTNYGRRAELAEFLVNAGAPNLMQKLAGQALSSWTPRGLGKLSASIGAEILAMNVGHLAAGPAGVASAAATLPFMSPRLMGELAYYTGKGARHLPIHGSAEAGYQTGRANNEINRRRALPQP